MKIFCDGSRFYGSQIESIEKGFIELGHEITSHIGEANLIYSNNPSPTRTQIVKDIKEGKTKRGAKFVTTILDFPEHLEHTESFQKEIPQIKADLSAADAVCSISEYTQKMVKLKYGFDSTVIYNPIKDVCLSPYIKRNVFATIVGRKFDPNKFVKTAIQACQILGVPEEQVLMVGSESVGWGNFQGVLSDENLNKVYNSAFFSFSLGEVEGINLPAIEAAACGCIPVINSKLTTRQELFPSSLFPEYDSVNADPVSIAKFIARFSQDNGAREDLTNRLTNHYNNNLKDKFSGRSVAQKILKIYENL
jgi:glycosyltransferase involved in cell wall biosynthesis